MSKLDIGGRLGVLGIVVGAAGGMAAMALPLAYPDFFTVKLWRLVFWPSAIIFLLGIFLVLCDLGLRSRIARICLYVLLLSVITVGGLFFFADQPWWIRGGIGASVGFGLWVGIPLIYSYMQSAELHPAIATPVASQQPQATSRSRSAFNVGTGHMSGIAVVGSRFSGFDSMFDTSKGGSVDNAVVAGTEVTASGQQGRPYTTIPTGFPKEQEDGTFLYTKFINVDMPLKAIRFVLKADNVIETEILHDQTSIGPAEPMKGGLLIKKIDNPSGAYIIYVSLREQDKDFEEQVSWDWPDRK